MSFVSLLVVITVVMLLLYIKSPSSVFVFVSCLLLLNSFILLRLPLVSFLCDSLDLYVVTHLVSQKRGCRNKGFYLNYYVIM